MKFRFFQVAALVILGGYFSSCKKDKTEKPPEYEIPTSYNFDNVDYAEATQAVNMWVGFTGYLGKSTSRQLSQDTVNYLWNNTNDAFKPDYVANLTYSAEQLNDFKGIKLSALTADPVIIKTFADSMVAVSAYFNTAGGEGVAGKQGNRLFNHDGFEFNQGVAKGLMGLFQMKNIFEHLDKSVTADNNTVAPGKGTAMEHEWDLAFGYVSIPRNYDSSVAYPSTDPNRPLAIGGYFRERARPIKAGGTVFSAFLKGRAAISAKDYEARDAAIATIKEFVEKTLAASAHAYLALAQSQGRERISQLHDLSEAYGFTVALKSRSANSKLSAANYTTLVNSLSTSFYTLLTEPGFTKLAAAAKIYTDTYGKLD